MSESDLKRHFNELSNMIESFFTRKTEKQGQEDFRTYREGVIREIPNMDHLLGEFPEFGAVAFLGKFQFVDCPEVTALAKDSSAEILEAIRVKKAIKLADSVRPAWDHLFAQDQNILCAIVALCFLASKKKTITNRL